jgi:hypothetical protein
MFHFFTFMGFIIKKWMNLKLFVFLKKCRTLDKYRFRKSRTKENFYCMKFLLWNRYKSSCLNFYSSFFSLFLPYLFPKRIYPYKNVRFSTKINFCEWKPWKKYYVWWEINKIGKRKEELMRWSQNRRKICTKCENSHRREKRKKKHLSFCA